MTKRKKEFEIDDRGWVREVRALNIESEKPKYVSANLRATEQEALDRLKKRFGDNTADIIRRSITQYDIILRIADGEIPDDVYKERER